VEHLALTSSRGEQVFVVLASPILGCAREDLGRYKIIEILC
jgi:hypothetical protein